MKMNQTKKQCTMNTQKHISISVWSRKMIRTKTVNLNGYWSMYWNGQDGQIKSNLIANKYG